MDWTTNLWSLHCLGRPLEIGSLYNATNDTFINQRDTISELDNPETIPRKAQSQTIITSDKLHDKANALKLTSHEKLSLFSGLVELVDSAKYFNNHQKNSKSVRVVLKFEQQGPILCVDPGQLAVDLSNSTFSATHVVAGVGYGWDAFFIFDKIIEKGMSLKQTKTKLEMLVSKMSQSTKDVARDDPFAKDIKCQLFADSSLTDAPTNFESAQEVFRLLKENPPTLIEKEIYLKPIKNHDQSQDCAIIGDQMVKRVEKILDEYNKIEADLVQFESLEMMEWVKNEAILLTYLTSLVREKFCQDLKTLVPKIRGNQLKAEDMASFLCQHQESGFSPQNFEMCFKTIHLTSSTIHKYLEDGKKAGVEFLVGQQMDDIIMDFEGKKLVAFCFKSNVLASKCLLQMKDRVFQNNFDKIEEETEWCTQKALDDMNQTFQIFLNYRGVNASAGINFVMMNDESECGEDSDSPVEICCYRGAGFSKVIQLPGDVPSVSCAGKTGTDWIELVVSPPGNGKEFFQEFVLSYYEEDEKSTKAMLTFPGSRSQFTQRVGNLLPGKKYFFQLQVTSEAGLSPPSCWSKGISTMSDERLALEMLKKCLPASDSNCFMEIYTPKDKFQVFSGDGLKKVEIGDSSKTNRQFMEKTIMVVGATGTGKTTFLNSMINYLYDVKEDDDFRFKIVTESDEGTESSQSKTSVVTAYCLNETRLKYRLIVVDTPGFGDTKGLQADKRTTGLIKNLFENHGSNGIDRLDAVCIVVKASDSRLTAQQRHNFDSVLQLFGKNMSKNIFIVATFSDASEPPVKASLKDAKIDYSKFFKFNNSAFFEGSKSGKLEKKSQKHYWDVGQNSFKSFFEELKKTKPVSLTLSLEVLSKRQQLESLVIDLHRSVKLGLGNLEEMRQELLIMERFQAQIEANQQFTYTIKQERVVQEDISGQGIHTTTCMHCNYTCHSDCVFADNGDKERCVAMSKDSGICEVCPSNCHWTMHKNMPFVCKIVEEEVTKTNEDLKAKYLKATDEKMTKEQMLQNLGEMFGQKQKHIMEVVKTIRVNIQELQEIAHRPKYMTDVDYIDILIESERSEVNPGWKERVQHLQDQRNLAVMIENAQDPNFNPFKKYEEEKGGWYKYAKKKFKLFFKFG